MRLEQRSVEIVGAALGHQRDLSARRPSFIRIVIRRRYPEFLDGILSNREHGRKCIAFDVGVDVYTIQRDIALVASRTIYGAAPGICIPVNIGTVAGVRHARLQREQLRDVPSFQREFLYLAFAKSSAKRRIRSVQRLRLRRHLYRLCRGSHFQDHIRTSGRIYEQLKIFLLVFAETSHFHGQRIGSWLQRGEFVFATRSRDYLSVQPLLRIIQAYFRHGYDSTGLVRYRSVYRGCAGLRRGKGRHNKNN